MDTTVIEFKNFGFQYRAQQKPTLYDVSFSVKKGEKILIAGPSGCGKSTIVHCLNGLIPFSYKGEMSGSLTVCGKETTKMSVFELSKHVGTVLQDSDSQFVGLTVAEDIAFALENDCVEESKLHERVREVAKIVNVGDFLKHAPGELSGGQKQRVSLAGVMVDDVDILLFDEPLANLDPATGKAAIELIDEIQKETGATVIIVEHRLEDVLHRHVDRVILMSEGRVVSDTNPADLLCSNILTENGIREPLYITALKYAGITVAPDMKPEHISTLTLTDSDKEKVRTWNEAIVPSQSIEKQDTLLKAEDIHYTYDNGCKALNGVSVEIAKGEMLAIVGTNGAGKSTFSKVVCGFDKPSSGKLIFANEDLSEKSIKERADKIGYVMQNPNQMICKVMITEEVGLGLVLRGKNKDEVEKKVADALTVCGLYRMRNWPVSALSFGQKKRVTIASILALDPEMIILDEPTAGQDYRHYTDIMEFLLSLNQSGITIVMITHDMHLMLEYATRAVVFSGGKIIADDTCANILTDPAIVEQASLKETSLYHLALLCGISNPTDYVSHFIDYERKAVRMHE